MAATTSEGLRERKKRQTRATIADAAMKLFVAHGFDTVTVADVARAADVSQKTVFNYFPTKESLVLDRFDVTTASVRAALAEPGAGPVQAALRVLAGELDAVASWLESQQDLAGTIAKFQRFDALVLSTPALRAYQLAEQDKLIAAAAEAMAQRAGISAEDPEPRIAAAALIALWDIHFRSLAKHLAHIRTSADLKQLRPAVTADVRRAAQLLENGLRTF